MEMISQMRSMDFCCARKDQGVKTKLQGDRQSAAQRLQLCIQQGMAKHWELQCVLQKDVLWKAINSCEDSCMWI
jgi:hypothetical protein